MDIKNIIKDWLIKKGYTGLTYDKNICACSIDNLMLCGEARWALNFCKPERSKK
jgi:hypothetical protein